MRIFSANENKSPLGIFFRENEYTSTPLRSPKCIFANAGALTLAFAEWDGAAIGWRWPNPITICFSRISLSTLATSGDRADRKFREEAVGCWEESGERGQIKARRNQWMNSTD